MGNVLHSPQDPIRPNGQVEDLCVRFDFWDAQLCPDIVEVLEDKALQTWRCLTWDAVNVVVKGQLVIVERIPHVQTFQDQLCQLFLHIYNMELKVAHISVLRNILKYAYLDLLIGIVEGKLGVISIVDIDSASVDYLDLGNGSKLAVQPGIFYKFNIGKLCLLIFAYLSRLIFLLPKGFKKA